MSVRFLADGMLGGLARWLRILGQAVEYDSQLTDNLLLKKASTGGIILLTRDEELYRRALQKKIACLLVQGNVEPERLAEVSHSFNIPLEIDMAKTKCPKCGIDIQRVPKDKVVGRVPETSLRVHNEFWECMNPECGKIYWMGGHWRQIHNTLEKARLLLANKS
ncbi:MAG TPA: Mut7-C RNAse domain-containing protein [Candidatus Binatus sp.]|nr:Mut7-C RNAse domain-containing protein [Candidatus Binatus sp.]